MVIGGAKALGVAVAFPILYRYLVEIIISLTKSVVTAMGSGDPGTGMKLIDNLLAGLQEGTSIILILLYFVGFIILFFSLVKRGVELLALRLGVPIAAIGFVDSDDGVWKSYVQLLFRQAATTMVQGFFMAFSLRMLTQTALLTTPLYLIAILMEFAALSAPKLLSQIMVPGGGSGQGAMNVITSAVRLVAK